MPTPVLLLGLALAGLAFLLRTGIHYGRTPGGVDTWYYLAYADAFRARRRLPVRLPQYLLQDEAQSYPPLFPMFLSLLPRGWLRRYYWVVSPSLDCLHLLLLYTLAYRITRDAGVAALTGGLYAVTPHLVSETRNLNGRSFAALLHTIATVLLLRAVVFDAGWAWTTVAVLAGAALFLASATSAVAYVVVGLAQGILFADLRYPVLVAAAGLLAFGLSGGHLMDVVANYVHALAYWRRNRARFGAHPVRDSPVYGTEPARPRVEPGLLGGSTLQLLLRLLAENPFVLALPFAPRGIPPWGTHLFVWAVVLTLLAVFATLLPPLRAFGPGRGYVKTAVFPTAYTLAVAIGTGGDLATPVGLVTLSALVASLAAIAFFFVHAATRQTEHTATTPEGLARATAHLAQAPGDGVFCLPYMYADYVAYHSGKKILWGGHCGDLRALEAVAPVITRPLPELLASHGAEYLLLDRRYATPSDLRLDGTVASVGEWDHFELWRLRSEGEAPTP